MSQLFKVARFTPHALFFVLLSLIFLPSIAEVKNKGVFLGVVILFELVLLIKHKSKAAHDIVFFVFAFLAFWEFSTTKIPNSNIMLYPTPENVFAVYFSDWRKILTGIGSSMYLLLTGFLTAVISGIIFGMIAGWFTRIREAVFPIAKVISPIPPIIYTPYAVALLPSFQLASIFVIFSSIFWSVFISMILSVSNIDRKLLESAKTLNVKSTTMLWNILLPYCLPQVMKGLPISIANAFMVLTAAEMIGATSGLGWFVKYYSDFSDYTRVVAGIILIGVVVSLINLLIAAIEKKVIRWR
ncbi:MAG: ABC-type nitrate/sulfonate/bicarbonate transport system, permease component [Massilibacillus sp.]|jgi:NitT/TauT family transport system permease protein|nr:ABC-type nitrate/sulfonate/bicarbonate transport system, permease component [Massilibacillus sp.]